MFTEIFLFELDYRRVRPVTYIYFIIAFVLSFLIVTSPTLKLSGAIGQVKGNAPYIIAYLTVALSLLFTIITSSVMGVAIVRDFDNNMEAIMFSTPMRKGEYLFGRFAGSFLVLILINFAIVLGLVAGFSLGKHLPWEVAWRSKELVPFMPWHYLQPFLLFTVVNIFTIGAFFFMSGALWRNSIIIYTQGIILLILYQISNIFFVDLDLKNVASLIDPFGFQTFIATTIYWTPAEQNTTLVPLTNIILVNRLIWLGLGTLALVFTYKGFSFNVVRGTFFGKKQHAISPNIIASEIGKIRFAKQVINTRTYARQLLSLSLLYFRLVWREIPFLAIVISGILLLFVNATKINQLYGTSSYLTTNTILALINNSFGLFLSIIAIFYSGELIWKEREVRFNLIMDTVPMLDMISLLSKFFGLLLVYSSILLILIISGILVQLYHHFYDIELLIYLETLFSQTLTALALYTAFFLFVQALVNNKFLGFALSIVFLLVNSLLPQLGIEHSLLRFASGSLGVFSDMNLYGHFVTPFAWLRLYWSGGALLLFCLATLLVVHGPEDNIGSRWIASRLKITPFLKFSILGALILFVSSGFYIYYNTNIVNRFEKINDHERQQAMYEQLFKKYDSLPQPKIVACNVDFELYPSQRNFTTEGYYFLKNKSDKPIHTIHVQHVLDNQSQIEYLKFNVNAHISSADEAFKHFAYDLDDALQPGDSVKMSFKLNFSTRGFVDGKSNTDIVYNGTFLNNSYLPTLGYNKNIGLKDRDLRQRYGLGQTPAIVSDNDPNASAVNLFGDDADHIRFEATIGTEPDQVAIAPGYLQRQWTANGRSYFHYKMDKPMANFFSIVSGRYALLKENWNGIDLEIYYHPGHTYNISRMMQSMKDALQYYSSNFSPFQFHELRIMEFPRYAQFAQSFATTIPFSEGLGFILKIDNKEKDLDLVYYLTAHEVAHQWWGHQVMEAEASGSALLSESLAQYSALMVLKHASSEAAIQRYLKYELDSYLKGRAQEKNQEQPLVSVEKQPYIHYNKSSLVFYALQDYLGEGKVNEALSRYNQKWAYKDGPYPTAKNLVDEIRKVTPDSLQFLITDMFENITLFDNKTQSVVYEERPDGKYDVSITFSNQKIRATRAREEQEIPIHDWIDIGIYSRNKNGEETLIYLKKHLISKSINKLTITVDRAPSRVGIDPLCKLIDKHPDDNIIAAHKLIGIENLVIQ